MTFGRRITANEIRLVGRVWNDVAEGLQELLRDLLKAQDNGLPPGGSTATPAALTVGSAGSPGTLTDGWTPPSHVHPVTRGAALGLANANADGATGAFADGGHQHKRDVRVRQAGVELAIANSVDFYDTETVTFALGYNAVSDAVEIEANVPAGVTIPSLARMIFMAGR